jgi:hypothetical protein
MGVSVLTDGEQALVPLRGCTTCGTFGFVGPDGKREKCQECKGVGCVAGEPVCAAPDCAAQRAFCSWYCSAHGPRYVFNDRLDMN